jgi:excisionase family DNA binding protein
VPIEMYTVREIAQALKLAEKTVYSMAADGDLPAFKVRGQWRIRRTDFERWLGAQSGAVAQPDKHSANAEGDPMLFESPLENPVADLSERVPQAELHARLVSALGAFVKGHAEFDTKPFELDLAPPLPQRVRVYMYNATRPPGGRPQGEHKVQLIVPGQGRKDRGSFDNTGGRIVLLIGYAAEEDVFILWDAGLYPDFAWSRNVQVKVETIIQATAGKIAMQERQLRPPSGRQISETVLAAKPRRLVDAIVRRMELTRERLLRE